MTKALAEIQVIPIGVGVSVRKEVQRAHEIIQASGLKVQLHSYGTNVEGDLDTILSTIKQIHETLHAEAPRGFPRQSRSEHGPTKIRNSKTSSSSLPN